MKKIITLLFKRKEFVCQPAKAFMIFAILFLTHFSYSIVSPVDNKKVKICLCMIVKNESKIISRCLDAVKDIVDYVSICDTGSSDKTIHLIQAFINQNDIPGTVHNHAWENFGHNRTLSVKAAQEALKKDGFSLENTYLLFLDADLILKIDSSFNKNDLKDDSYVMIQKDWFTSYYNLRLGKASFDWKSIGVTHEYWAADGAYRQGKIESLYINDINDGGCKSDKFERDIRLLTQGLRDEPNNERYMFYMAQSHQNIQPQQWDKAIEWYMKRIERGGWYEEVWLSKYKIGQCYEGKGDWDNAFKAYLEAFQYHPTRAEPLSSIASYYLSIGKNDLASIFANYGKNIKYPSSDVLLIEHDVYNYKFLQSLSIASYYTMFRSKGLKFLDKLLLSKQTPAHVKQNCYSNLYHYVENLPHTEFRSIEPEKTSLLNDWSSDRYMPTNPCIHKTISGYILNCRTVNYHQKYPKYLIFSEDECIKTKNIVINYDNNLNKLAESQVVDHPNLVKYQAKKIQGLEDMRLFSLDDETYFTATTWQLHPGGLPQICVGKFQDFNNGFILVDNITLLKGPDAERCEKNWLPFVIGKELHVIYLYDPFIIYKVNITTGDCELVLNKEYNVDFKTFRGSSAPIEFDNGYLLTVHEVIWLDRGYYVHRFMYLDKNLEVKKLSRPFTFKHKGVEFCAGMIYDELKNALVLSVGIEDREACLCSVGADYVRSMLEPLEK